MIKLVITRFLCTLFYTVVESNSLCTLSIQWLSPIVKKTFDCALLFETVGQSNQDKACGCGELECSKEW